MYVFLWGGLLVTTQRSLTICLGLVLGQGPRVPYSCVVLVLPLLLSQVPLSDGEDMALAVLSPASCLLGVW